jgi:transcriptional regulator with XRE-family HTH domain
MLRVHPLARWRKLRYLTQAELAALVDVKREAIARYELGAEPRARMAVRLAAALRAPHPDDPRSRYPLPQVADIWTADGSEPPRLRDEWTKARLAGYV